MHAPLTAHETQRLERGDNLARDPRVDLCRVEREVLITLCGVSEEECRSVGEQLALHAKCVRFLMLVLLWDASADWPEV
ncbi:hypothetical protein [Corallococcus sicarius]|uniref:hypothetical protein n=1 Tax=Corallococcus sicarius TaxID=2316726 RepID=UPI00142EC3DD|nr:hypothetical protein [Corallococcus sicarius]